MFRFFVLACLAAVTFAQNGPPFLSGASAAAVEEFNKMSETFGDLTETAVTAKVEAWIATQTADVKAAYAKFKAAEDAYQKEGVAARAKAIAKLSAAAKEAEAKLNAITNSATLTLNQKGEQLDALRKSLDPKIAEEIEKAMEASQ